VWIEKKSGDVNGSFIKHSVVFIEYKPSHFDGMEYMAIMELRVGVVYLIN
jgi:hypothetical protein